MSAADPVDVAGTWDLTIRTPVGRQDVRLVVERDAAGVLAGRAVGAGETVPLSDLRQDGTTLAWEQSITRPLRLTLRFTVTVAGDELAGTSKAGRLPSSRVSGCRSPRPGGGERQ